MAQITGTTSEKIFSIPAWLGLNENPNGDTKLKVGQAAVMRNFRITRDMNLQRRPGAERLIDLTDESGLGLSGRVQSLWQGMVGQYKMVLCAMDNKIIRLYTSQTSVFSPVILGSYTGLKRPSFFGFDSKVYVLTGEEYLVYDGTSLSDVTATAYIPLVAVSAPPAGGGSTLEQINKLTGKRRMWFSPDGTAKDFQLPEKGLVLDSVTVKDLKTGEAVTTGWTADASTGIVSFENAPAEDVNSIEIGWAMATDFRTQVEHMLFAELFNGTNDGRVFLYGDGSNKMLYSDIDYDGRARADYFPDQNEMLIGEANTPVTGAVAHLSRLYVAKTDSSYVVSSSMTTLADGTLTSAYYIVPVNRILGNEAPGQARIVMNDPLTLFGRDVYQWYNASSYSSSMTIDERQAKRISDRICTTIKTFSTPDCITANCIGNQEYYILDPLLGEALVYGYAANAWYYYTGLKASCMVEMDGVIYFGTTNGKLMRFNDQKRVDEVDSIETPAAIDAYWESGSMSMGSEVNRKTSAMLWISMKPEAHSHIDVTLETDRGDSATTKNIQYSFGTFTTWNFADFSFAQNVRPQAKRLKLKAKKFVYYKLILENTKTDTEATVLAANIKVRFQGYSK